MNGESSTKLLQSLMLTAAKIERPAGRCQAYLQLAHGFLAAGESAAVGELLAAAEKAAGTLKRPEEKAAILARMGLVYAKAGDAVKAADGFTRATLLARAAETAEQRAGALYEAASAMADAGLKEKAAALLAELREIAIVPENNLDTTSELIGIAEIYTDIGQVQESRKILAQAWTRASEIKDVWFKAQRLTEIAQEYLRSETKYEAEKILNELLPLADQVEESNWIYFSLAIADLLTELEKREQALGILTTALGIARTNEVVETKANDLVDIAERFEAMGEQKLAAEMVNEASGVAAAMENPADKVASLIRMASFTKEMGSAEKALGLAQKAHELSRALADKRATMHYLGELALLYWKMERREEASELVAAIVKVAQDGKEKTAGLGPLVGDLAEAGAVEMAVRLAGVIREPEVKVGAVAAVLRIAGEKGEVSEDIGEKLLGIV